MLIKADKYTTNETRKVFLVSLIQLNSCKLDFPEYVKAQSTEYTFVVLIINFIDLVGSYMQCNFTFGTN